MFCMYKFISAAKAPEVRKQHEQEMRRRAGSSIIGRPHSGSVCVAAAQLNLVVQSDVTECRYAYAPLQQFDGEESNVLL